MTGLEVVLASLVGISMIALLATRYSATISKVAIPTVGRTPAFSARSSVLLPFIASVVGSFLISMTLIGGIQNVLAMVASVLGPVATVLALPAVALMAGVMAARRRGRHRRAGAAVAGAMVGWFSFLLFYVSMWALNPPCCNP